MYFCFISNFKKMASRKGKITSEKIADRSAYEFGQKFAKSLNPTIKKIIELEEKLKDTNIQFTNLITKKHNLSKEFGKVKSEQDLIKAMQKKNGIVEQTSALYKEQGRLEKALISTKAKLELSYEGANRGLIRERTLLNENNKAIRYQTRESLGLIGAYQKLNKQRTDAQKRLADLLATEQKNIPNQKAHQKEIAKTRAEYEKLNKRVLAIDKSTDNFTKNIGNYKSALGGLTGTFRSLVSAFGIAGGIYTFVNVIKNGTNIVRDFGATMSNVAGIYRTSRKDIAGLEEKIIAVAGASVKTATEVAQLAESLATLGKSPDEVEKLLEPVNNLSIGLKASSDEAGEFLVQTMNAFGASSDEAEKYADVLATVRTSTSLDFQKMKDSFQYLSPISKALGKDIAYTGALIGLLADNGIKAERAGRLMATAQQKLASEGKNLNSALEELNQAKKEGATKDELMALSSKLFGTQANALGLILAENTGKVERNADAIRKNSGALKDLVNEQLKSLDAHFKILKSRWEEYILNTNKSTGASEKLKAVLKYLADNLDKVISFIIKSVKIWASYKLTIIAVSGITKAYVGITTALRLAKIALSGGIGKATKSMKLFNLATKSNPIGFLLGLLAAAVTAFIAFGEGASSAAAKQRLLNKAIKDGKDSAQDYSNVAKQKIEEEIEAINERTRAELVGVKSQNKIGEIQKKAINEKIELIKKERKAVDDRMIAYAKQMQSYKEDTPAYRQQATLLQEESNLRDFLSRKINSLSTDRKIENQIIKDANKEKNKQTEAERKKREQEAEARRKKMLTDAHSLSKFYIQSEINTQKEIIENENNSYLIRLQATKDYKSKQEELAQKETAYKLQILGNLTKKEIEALINNGEEKKGVLKKLTDEELLIYEQLQAKKQEFKKKQEEQAGKVYLKRLEKLTDYEEQAQKDLNTKTEKLRADFQNGKIKSVEEYEKELAKIKFENSRDLLDEQIKFLNEELTNYADTTEKKIIIEKELAKVRKELNDLTFENSKNKDSGKIFEDLQKIKGQINDTASVIANAFGINQGVISNFFDSIVNGFDKGKKKAERFAEIAKASIIVVGEIGNAIYQNRINEIDEEIAKSDEYYNGEIEKAQNKYDQDGRLLEDGELRKKILEEEREKKKQQLEKKKRQEQRKQANFNKAMSIFEIGINTATAITKVLANPFLVGLVAALGAVQLATVLATPLPKYKLGLNKANKPHFAIVGDGGQSEVIEKQTGEAYITPAKDTLTYLEKGDRVYPSLQKFQQEVQPINYEEILRLNRLAEFKKIGKLAQKHQEKITLNNNLSESKTAQETKHNIYLLKGELKSAILEGFKSVKIHNHNNIDLDDYVSGWERG